MPNLTNPCDLLLAAADAVKRSGGMDRASFKRELEAKFGPGLADEAVADLHDAAKQMLAKQDRAAKRLADAQAQRARQMAGLDRTTWSEALTSSWKAGVLGNIRTIRRNFESNAVQALRREGLRPVDAAMDMLLSLASGRRTVEGGTFFTGDFVGRTAATLRGTKEDISNIAKHGVPTSELNRLDAYREMNTGGNNVLSKAFDAYVNWSMRFQSVQDRPWFQSAYHRSIEEQARLMARAEMEAGSKIDSAKRVSELIANPTEAMETQAIIDGEVATFARPNQFSTWMNRAEGGGLRTFLDLLVPFRKVPGNVAADVVTANPLGMLGNMWRYGRIMSDTTLPESARAAAQKRLAGLMTNGVAGSALLYYGYQLAEAGILKGAGSGDRAQRDTDEALGVRPASVLIGEERRSLAGLHPMLNVLVLGATIHDNMEAALEAQAKRDKVAERKGLPKLAAADIATALAQSGWNLGDLLADQPFAQGAKRISDAVKDDKGVMRFVGDTAGSFVPTAIPDFGALLGDNEMLRVGEGLGGGIENRIPGFRTQLPPKITALGETVPMATGLSVGDIYSTRPDPRIATDPVKRWVFENGIKVSKVPREQGESAQEYADRLLYVGKAMKERLTVEAAQNPRPDAQEKERIQAVMQAVRRGANARYMVTKRAERVELPPPDTEHP